MKESRQYLKRGGWLIFEIGSDQAEAVKTLLQEAGYENIEVKKDLAGLTASYMACIVENKFAASPLALDSG